MKRTMSIACFLVIACAMLLAGCKKEQPIAEKPPKPKEEKYQFPLTGLKTNDEEATGVRPVAVVVNNDPKARPQTGLNEADVIYEVLAEGNVTRFLAIYQSEKPANIGPVRSARPYFIDLAKGYDALFIAHGWSPRAKEILQSGTVDNINGIAHDGTLFKRASFRKAPHNSYISYENIEKGAEMSDYTLEQSVDPLPFFTEKSDVEGDEANEVTVQYGSRYDVTYDYDATNQEYTRYTNEELTVDYETDEPLKVANILIIEASHQVTDDAGRRDIDLTSGGDAVLLQNGVVRHLQWANEHGRIVPKTTDEDVEFAPGRTWIHIIPHNPGLNQAIKLSEME